MGGWVDRKREENEGVRMSYCGSCMVGWVGGWVGETYVPEDCFEGAAFSCCVKRGFGVGHPFLLSSSSSSSSSFSSPSFSVCVGGEGRGGLALKHFEGFEVAAVGGWEGGFGWMGLGGGGRGEEAVRTSYCKLYMGGRVGGRRAVLFGLGGWVGGWVGYNI